MTGRTEMGALMAGVGPRLELAEVTAFAERGTWTLAADPSTVVFADWDEERQGVCLSAEAGIPPRGADLAELYGTLLRFNNHWAETGGARTALDGPGPDAAVVLIYDLPAAGLDLDRLALVLGNFLDTLRAWREIVAHDRAATPDEGTSFDPMRAGFIRG